MGSFLPPEHRETDGVATTATRIHPGPPFRPRCTWEDVDREIGHISKIVGRRDPIVPHDGREASPHPPPSRFHATCTTTLRTKALDRRWTGENAPTRGMLDPTYNPKHCLDRSSFVQEGTRHAPLLDVSLRLFLKERCMSGRRRTCTRSFACPSTPRRRNPNVSRVRKYRCLPRC